MGFYFGNEAKGWRIIVFDAQELEHKIYLDTKEEAIEEYNLQNNLPVSTLPCLLQSLRSCLSTLEHDNLELDVWVREYL